MRSPTSIHAVNSARTFARLLLIGVLSCVSAPLVCGQSNTVARGPAVLIIADMEGAMGIADPELLYGSAAHAVYGRALLTREVNAAIRGTRAAGAGKVVFSDSHYRGDNILWRDMPEGTMRLRPHALEGTRAEVAQIFAAWQPKAVILLGYHVRTGGAGFLPHTFTTRNFVRINGREYGEIGMLAAVAGDYGVPVVTVSGDRGAVEEAQAFVPGVRTAATKELLPDGRMALVQLADAEQAVERAVMEGITHPPTPVRISAPVHWEYELRAGSSPPSVPLPSGVTQQGTVFRWESPNYFDGYRTMLQMMAASH